MIPTVKNLGQVAWEFIEAKDSSTIWLLLEHEALIRHCLHRRVSHPRVGHLLGGRFLGVGVPAVAALVAMACNAGVAVLEGACHSRALAILVLSIVVFCMYP